MTFDRPREIFLHSVGNQLHDIRHSLKILALLPGIAVMVDGKGKMKHQMQSN